MILGLRRSLARADIGAVLRQQRDMPHTERAAIIDQIQSNTTTSCFKRYPPTRLIGAAPLPRHSRGAGRSVPCRRRLLPLSPVTGAGLWRRDSRRGARQQRDEIIDIDKSEIICYSGVYTAASVHNLVNIVVPLY